MTYYLAIDQGSHASRAILFDGSGTCIATCSKDVVVNRFSDGRVEHDAKQLLSSVRDVISELLAGLSKEEKQSITACGIATQRSTVLAWHANGKPIGPVLSWQDVRAAKFLKALRSHEQQIKLITGLPLSAHYGASKLNWLLDKESRKDNFETDDIRLSPLASFLLYHLIESKPYCVDHSNAQRTQLMELATLDWSEHLTHWFDVPVRYLPECRPMCANYGILSGTKVDVTAVCGDQNAALFGAGVINKDTALINIGSGAFILRPINENISSEKQLTGIACSDGNIVSYLREATVNGSGNALDWVASKYNITGIKQRLPEWLRTVEDPPLFINAVGGLGSPWWRQDIQSEFISHEDLNDIDINNKAALVVAVIESIVFMLRINLDLMVEELPLKVLRATGGLSNLDGLCQKLANLCDLPVERTEDTEATARGVAWLAAGRPENWEPSVSADIFCPIADKALNKRYSQYVARLEKKLA